MSDTRFDMLEFGDAAPKASQTSLSLRLPVVCRFVKVLQQSRMQMVTGLMPSVFSLPQPTATLQRFGRTSAFP